MYCSKCGVKLDNDQAKFCPQCGCKLQVSSSQERVKPWYFEAWFTVLMIFICYPASIVLVLTNSYITIKRKLIYLLLLLSPIILVLTAVIIDTLGSHKTPVP